MTGTPSPPGKTFSEDGPSLADFLPDTSSGYTAYAGTAPDEGTGSPLTEEAVITAVKTVKDPEIPVNIYDLGLIYGVIGTKRQCGYQYVPDRTWLPCRWRCQHGCRRGGRR